MWGGPRSLLHEGIEPSLVSYDFWPRSPKVKATLLLGGKFEGKTLPNYVVVENDPENTNWGKPTTSVSEGILSFFAASHTERNSALWASARGKKSRRLSGMAALGRDG